MALLPPSFIGAPLALAIVDRLTTPRVARFLA